VKLRGLRPGLNDLVAPALQPGALRRLRLMRLVLLDQLGRGEAVVALYEGEVEQVEMRRVRFRSLGDYPLSGAVEGEAADVYDIIHDIEVNRQSERAGRLIDGEGAQSMERKKAEGYF